MTSKKVAPYHHADGSNCWTKGCRTGNTSSVQGSIKQSLEVLSNRISDLKRQEHDKAHKELQKSIHLGSEVNKMFSFRTHLKGGYQPAKHTPAKNHIGDIGWNKPGGGVWIATVNEDGSDSWADLLGDGSDLMKGSQPTSVRFTDDAKVAVIDSKEDYLRVLDAYPHYPILDSVGQRTAELLGDYGSSSITLTGETRRTIDFESMAKEYDGIVLTWKGLYSCGRKEFKGSSMGNDVSLYMWDIESVFVMNSKALKVIS